MFGMTETIPAGIVMTPKEAAASRFTDLIISVTGRKPSAKLVDIFIDGLIEAAKEATQAAAIAGAGDIATIPLPATTKPSTKQKGGTDV